MLPLPTAQEGEVLEIKVVKIAPLGDPMELNVRGYELSIRKSEAESIEVQ